MSPVLGNRAAIAARLPHGPTMCVLESVVEDTAARIRCHGRATDADAHPLASGGHLHAVHALEYAAQAAALHSSLRADAQWPHGGLVAAVRDLAWDGAWLRGTLEVTCEQLAADARHCSYAFHVVDAAGVTVRGRLTVVFEAEESV